MSAPQPELLACPMCALERVIIAEQTIPKVGNPWRVGCNVCFLSTGQYITRSEAITAWNTRATDPKAQALADAVSEWAQATDEFSTFEHENPNNSTKVWARLLDATGTAEDNLRAALAAWDAKP